MKAEYENRGSPQHIDGDHPRPAVYRFPLRELKNDCSKLFLKWLSIQSSLL